MRLQAALSLFFTLGFATGVQQKADPQCRCVPGDDCWPSACHWQTFHRELGKGKLIKTSATAESCYDGPHKDLEECAYVTRMWSDQDFQTSKPIGRPYPYNITCAPVNYTAGEIPTSCALGPLPLYAVNATTREDIALTLDFAKRNNIRLVVTSTGHDLLGRSDGYGSLQVWLRHFRNGIYFQKTFKSSKSCKKSGWKGSALHIDGAWQWRDVYEVAEANNVIAVGGGAISPGAIGGWPSGGGHGPATRNYGLGADQILEAEVMLADGTIVTANHCENTDLFRAIRGGGPGYGIVLSQHIKAHPNVDAVTVHRLAIAPLQQTPENADLLDAVSVLLQHFPNLNDKGYAGYGFWFRNFPRPFVGEARSGYTHGIWTIGKRQDEAERAIARTLKALEKFRDKLFIHSTFAEYPDYWSFYHAESGLYDPTGDTSILTSRMINKKAVSNYKKVRETVEIISGRPEEFVSNVVLLVSGGQVFKDASDKTSGLHPAWRESPFVLITGQGIPKVASHEIRQYVTNEITHVKGAALKKLAPNTGGYMNEGDRHDPDYIKTFYGSNYRSHLAAKKKYDPDFVFYCPSCVGAEMFIERPDGPLCWKS
ncbi:6-hydroxy-D-nicotine oxidase [Madurella mycetomatis]|uniref:6-hydroxy-D-nicotine oxidase n=1 Tax=Madurella mycetomatis TaxID=100816 RepID=A0A175VWV4_9PEZI|nr:6-hydroxy-D-nicotine oxidase [Madurella mycetomatis]KXX76050.1 6-hydroxy-D-nicotine oxidase [Madurella mycetomatis]